MSVNCPVAVQYLWDTHSFIYNCNNRIIMKCSGSVTVLVEQTTRFESSLSAWYPHSSYLIKLL
jgi:hypothetical protein